MNAFRVLLVLMTAGIVGYTGVVGVNHGWNLVPIFFGDMAAMSWPGQFNFDFSCFLMLSGLWLAWRHHFSAGGLVLGVLGAILGIMLLAPYLLVMSFRVKGEVHALLVGPARSGNAARLH